MSACLFCAIAAGKAPAEILYEDELTVAFRDIHPQSPVHILVIPKKHISSADVVTDFAIYSALMRTVKVLAQRYCDSSGYRVVINCGEAAGQTIPHLHIHLLSGRAFHWPPG